MDRLQHRDFGGMNLAAISVGFALLFGCEREPPLTNELLVKERVGSDFYIRASAEELRQFREVPVAELLRDYSSFAGSKIVLVGGIASSRSGAVREAVPIAKGLSTTMVLEAVENYTDYHYCDHAYPEQSITVRVYERPFDHVSLYTTSFMVQVPLLPASAEGRIVVNAVHAVLK